MNNINQWNKVITVLEQEGFKHEEAVLLLHKADLPNPGLFERIGMTIKDRFGGFRDQLQRRQPASHHGNRATTRRIVT